MPLNRRNITRASEIMVWAYPLFALPYGATLAFVPEHELTVSQSFVTADRWMDLTLWGVLFMLVGVFQILTLILTRSRATYVVALAVMLAGMTVWTGVFATSVVTDDAVPLAPLWPAFVCIACIASLRSLISQEDGGNRG